MIAVEDLGHCEFGDAIDCMNRRVASLVSGESPERILVLEPRPVITLGRDTRSSSLVVPLEEIRAKGIPTVEVGRGGDVTWHGPGQLVFFPLVRLGRRRLDVYSFIELMVRCVAETLAAFGIEADPPGDEIGVWVRQKKIASIGIRHEDGIASHGIALNVCPDFEWLDYINPCGDPGRNVTSFELLLGDCPTIEHVKAIFLARLRSGLEVSPPRRTGVSHARV